MNEVGPARADPWRDLRRFTSARIAIGSSGNSVTTAELLRFGVAHAQARDAVHLALDAAMLNEALQAHGIEVITVESAAPDRATYLRRPDLGRVLGEDSRQLLGERAGRTPAAPDRAGEADGETADGTADRTADETAREQLGCDLLIVIGDGLSAAAVHGHAVALVLGLRPLLEAAGLRCGPVVIARQARVALGDPVGAALRARAVLVLIGERPGLSSPDSLGAYLTWAPRPGLADSQRNCVSNIRPEGLPIAAAAHKLAWLITEAGRLGRTGIALKDGSDALLVEDVGALPAGGAGARGGEVTG